MAAAEAKKGVKVARGGKKGFKTQAEVKQKARGYGIVKESGEEPVSEVENKKDDEKVQNHVCTFMFQLMVHCYE